MILVSLNTGELYCKDAYKKKISKVVASEIFDREYCKLTLRPANPLADQNGRLRRVY